MAEGMTTLNALLIKNHHAVKYTGQSKESIAEEHLINRGLLRLSKTASDMEKI